MTERRDFSAEELDRREQVDGLLSETFNAILRTEEKFLENNLTKGLTITEIHTIVAVGLNEANPMSIIAARLHVTLATLTTCIAKLVDKGYVMREKSQTDRRQVLIRLTKEGRKVYRAHGVFHRHMIDEALEGLTEQEEIVLGRALVRVREFFDCQASCLKTTKLKGAE